MKTVPLTIKSFSGDFYFLHNNYPCEVIFDKLVYPSAEHAYQAAKTVDDNQREIIRNLLDGDTARSYVHSHKSKFQRSDWIRIREAVMLQIIQSKFFNNIPLAKMLAETGNSALINCLPMGNVLDTYWGVRGSRGENRLGVILMHVRGMIQQAVKRSADARLSRVKFSNVSLTDGDVLLNQNGKEIPPNIDDYESAVNDHKAANDPDRTLPITPKPRRTITAADYDDAYPQGRPDLDGNIPGGFKRLP